MTSIRTGRLGRALVILILLLMTGGAGANIPSERDALATYMSLPPGERFRQLTFLLYVTEGFDQGLLAGTPAGVKPVPDEAPELADPGELQGAGLRIAGPGSILTSAAELIQFRQRYETEILAELSAIQTASPMLISMVDTEALAEESILVRLAITESVEAAYAGQPGGAPPALAEYHEQTLRQRNDLEFIAYAEEIDALTKESIVETTGRLDAFHRMADADADIAFVRERIQAAEQMNDELEAEHKRWARERTFRLLMLMTPAINRYFYYK